MAYHPLRKKGIKWLSELNVWLTLGLGAALLVLGPGVWLAQHFFSSFWLYLSRLPQMALASNSGSGNWVNGWTVFYWGWFLGYAPLMGLFTAGVSRGRSVRELVLAVAILCPLVTNIWFTLLGGSGLYLELANQGSITGPLAESGAAAALLAILTQLPLAWLGVPARRTKVLLVDSVPHGDVCEWISLGPLDLGVGRFQEISCFHRPSGALLVTDALVGISAEPPSLFDLDPTPLLFHARERGDQPLNDTHDARRRGWARLVLFASYLRPEPLEVPSLPDVLRHAFRPGLRSAKAHFGLYPFQWTSGWEAAAAELMREAEPKIQVAPVLERLVLPRAKESLLDWFEQLGQWSDLRWLVSAHYSAPISFTANTLRSLVQDLTERPWAPSTSNWEFLGSIDQRLLDLGVVPEQPRLRD